MKQALPIDDFIPEILTLIGHHQNLVMAAEPGAGKTTRLPPALLSAVQGKIFVLEPRRMAAIAAAERVAFEEGLKIGEEIGYQVRFENKTSNQTRLIFMTEALLSRRLLSDPELKGVGAIVLDEFHERSLNVDLALGMAKELQQMGHPLKIIVMSATLDVREVQKFLPDCASIDVPGKVFPLDVHHSPRQLKTRLHHDDFSEFASLVKKAFLENSGDLLAFLPGFGEIERVRRSLEGWANDSGVPVLALHGSVALEEQRRILAPSQHRRIVLSTNVAESSVTVNGVRTVVDSGLVKVLRQDPRTGFSRLELDKVSKASATQRAGRAARQGSGRCYRWWSIPEHEALENFEQPEVLRVDISECLMFLSAQGITEFGAFAWFQAPLPAQLNRATRDLQELEALDRSRALTPLGKRMLKWPLPPRLAKLMAVAEPLQQTSLAADLCALLLEKDLLRTGAAESHLGDSWECDLSLRWSLLNQWRSRQADRDVISHNARMVDAVARQMRRGDLAPREDQALDSITQLLFKAFPNRLCRRRGQTDRATMSGGRGVRLVNESVVKSSPFFIALDGVDQEGSADTLVRLACGFQTSQLESWLKNEIEVRQRAYFDEKSEKFLTVKETVWRDFVIAESQPRNASPDDVQIALVDALVKKFEWLKAQNPELENWFARWSFFVQNGGAKPFDESKIRTALEHAAFGSSALNDVAKKDLVSFFEMQLDPDIKGRFQREVPAKIQVPSGSWLKVEYSSNQPPFLQVRLQELFGLRSTPKIMNLIPLVIHLLAPNYRPVQTTSDLESFWRHGYFEVRKELKIRYPKHSWPEDPINATPEAKGRRRT